MGKRILHSMLDGPNGLLAKLNDQLLSANEGNTDPDRALTLIASRIPKISIQSWMLDSDAGNGVDNYFYILESKDPRTGKQVLSGLANEDIVRHFAETLIYPEAIVQQWEVNHLKEKFGADEANWMTEGQWLSEHSTIEQDRNTLEQAVDATIFTKLLNDTDLSDNIVIRSLGIKPVEANDYLIFNTTTKALYYDVDGSGLTYAPIQFATLTNTATVSASDFVVI